MSVRFATNFAVGGLCAASSALIPASALAIDFSFAFDNSVGNVPGTVSGRILGLANNATSAATQVYIDSAPAALGFGSFPIDVNTFYSVIDINTFTVSSGSMTNASFRATTSGTPPWFWLNVSGDCANNCSYLGNPGNNFVNVWTVGGMQAIRFAALDSEPDSVPGPLPVLGAAAAFGFSRKLRKRIKGAPPVASAID